MTFGSVSMSIRSESISTNRRNKNWRCLRNLAISSSPRCLQQVWPLVFVGLCTPLQHCCKDQPNAFATPRTSWPNDTCQRLSYISINFQTNNKEILENKKNSSYPSKLLPMPTAEWHKTERRVCARYLASIPASSVPSKFLLLWKHLLILKSFPFSNCSTVITNATTNLPLWFAQKMERLIFAIKKHHIANFE